MFTQTENNRNHEIHESSEKRKILVTDAVFRSSTHLKFAILIFRVFRGFTFHFEIFAFNFPRRSLRLCVSPTLCLLCVTTLLHFAEVVQKNMEF